MKQILVIKMSSLGDLFHALPAVRLLKTGLGAEIDWVVHDIYEDLARCFTDVRRVIPFPRKSLVADFPEFYSNLRADRYDLVVDFQGLLKSAIVARAAHGKKRIGPSFQREGARIFYDEVAGEKNKDRHAVDENLDVPRHLGLPAEPVEFPVRFPRVQLETTAPRVALVPCSRHAEKNWPVERFAEVGRALQEERDATVYVTGSRDDEAACAALEKELTGGRVMNVCGRTPLPELGGVLSQMDLVVSVDSGPMHMAAAAGRPVLAVFGPTHPARTGPYGPANRVIQQGDNLRDLQAEPVTRAALDMLPA